MLFGDRGQAASRFQGYLVHEHLRRRGRPSRLLAAPPFPHHDVPWPPAAHARIADLVAGEIVVFQKIWGANAEALLDALTESTTTLYAQADLSPENPLPLRCDGVICSSPALAGWHEARGVRAWYVADPAEVWLDPRPPRPRDRIRVCWIAHRKNLPTLEPLRALLAESEFAAYELVTVSNDSAADVLWSESAALEVLRSSDVGVVPARDAPEAPMASANRVVALMAAAVPVVASRLPSYENVIDHGRTGYLCDSPEDWRRALLELLDPERRAQVAAAGRASVDPAFRPQTIGDEWARVFDTYPAPSDAAPAARPRLAAYALMEAGASYARAGLERYYGLDVVLPQAGRSLAAAAVAPAGPRSALALVREVGRPVAGRIRAAVTRRVRR